MKVLDNVCKVMSRDEDGNAILSTISNKGVFTKADYDRLIKDIDRRMKPKSSHYLYYTVRTVIDGHKDNYRCSDYEALLGVLNNIFKVG